MFFFFFFVLSIVLVKVNGYDVMMMSIIFFLDLEGILGAMGYHMCHKV